MIQIMMNAYHKLIHSWGAVQRSAMLYNLAWYNATPLNPVYVEIS